MNGLTKIEEGRRKKEQVYIWGFRQGTFEEGSFQEQAAVPTQNERPK
ncbi:MAG: hypothetical protein KME60_02190 [Cyanomargarita calcarea GSE-NOS-MK-12-04C]|jgi:hypothetical protein|uniref:Uncharacterized protein n=1 Tax=Cyanomargarita calcarea GSE-NOS-MK-12-04C TaxID=2839659 RepID=A0A951URH9_9CYAN|nr:hypothetical protein [Cyanomargarita calcarea GSE-NOS-MK-12-04C]